MLVVPDSLPPETDRYPDCPPDVRAALDGVMDPCLAAAGHALSVLDLGLITRIRDEEGVIEIGITFTEVGCQFTHRVMVSIEDRVRALGRHHDVRIVPDWKPGWTEARMGERARSALANGRLRFSVRT